MFAVSLGVFGVGICITWDTEQQHSKDGGLSKCKGKPTNPHSVHKIPRFQILPQLIISIMT
jgi:hypothetical protein